MQPRLGKIASSKSATMESTYWHSTEHYESIIGQFDETMLGRSLLQTFVEPVIERPKQAEDEDIDSAFEKKFTVSDISESKGHIVS